MTTTTAAPAIITPETFLRHWQGHRSLTRRVIEAFPDKELFEFSMGGMRTFGDMAKELLSIAAPGLREIVTGKAEKQDEEMAEIKTKEDILKKWDESTGLINIYFSQLTPERFMEEHNLFGQYKSPIIQNVGYFVDNEIHHRAQGYVYLRALGIEPPAFWDRVF